MAGKTVAGKRVVGKRVVGSSSAAERRQTASMSICVYVSKCQHSRTRVHV